MPMPGCAPAHVRHQRRNVISPVPDRAELACRAAAAWNRRGASPPRPQTAAEPRPPRSAAYAALSNKPSSSLRCEGSAWVWLAICSNREGGRGTIRPTGTGPPTSRSNGYIPPDASVHFATPHRIGNTPSGQEPTSCAWADKGVAANTDGTIAAAGLQTLIRFRTRSLYGRFDCAGLRVSASIRLL
jgi:hypothetical protein